MLTETVPGMEPEAAKLVLAALGYSLTLPPLSGETRRKLLDRSRHADGMTGCGSVSEPRSFSTWRTRLSFLNDRDDQLPVKITGRKLR